jgi:DNA-binding NarL/FixJ family response regulator
MIRIVVVDDHPVVRQGLIAILRYEPDIDVVGSAADGVSAVQLIQEQRPDLVLLDLHLPGLSGVEVMTQLRSLGVQTRYLILTTFDTDEYIVPALTAGAQGYLLKDSPTEELGRAIRTLMQGGAAIEPSVAARLLTRMHEPSPEVLSEREREVLQLLVAGASNKVIAAQLHLSEHTIKTHLSRIFGKLDVQSRAEAVAVALQRKLV